MDYQPRLNCHCVNDLYGLGCNLNDGLKELVLMQWTGIKDKNGVDIYEGDIVRKDTLGDNWIVLWFAPTYAGYVIFKPNEGYIPGDWRGGYNELDGRHGAFGSTHKLDVIGNIYENPELLS